MTFEINEIFLLGLIYLSVLFAIAYCTDRGWIPSRIVRHPFVYVLSLGVFTSAWGFFGIIGLAHEYSFGFLSYYLGIAGFFIFGPLFLLPLQKICQDYQLTSLADLLTFRYRSQLAGVLVTVFLLIGMLPLLALQIQAVTDAAFILTQVDSTQPLADGPHVNLAFIFCVVISIFTITYGAGHISYRKRHNGLVAAIAFETLVKGIAFGVIGLAAIFGIFGSIGELSAWLEIQQVRLDQVNNFHPGHTSRTLLLIAFAAAVAAPHMFHMVFSEKPTRTALRTAVWGVPLLLLLLSLPVLPILWGGMASQSSLSPEYYTLGIGLALESHWLMAIGYLCALSAASGVIIVSTLALASMCLNHLILPFYQPAVEQNIYRWLIWIRRLLIAAIILSGYIFYRVFATSGQLSPLGVAAFSAMLQFLPGVFAVLYGPRINHQGMIAGLTGGFLTWFFTLFLPVLTDTWLEIPGLEPGNAWIQDTWSNSVLISIAVNIGLMILVSWFTRTSTEEQSAAILCSLDNLARPPRQTLGLGSARDMQAALASDLGSEVAEREMYRALQTLELTLEETRPYALRRLRDQVEANLSGLLGTTVAMEMVNRLFPYTGERVDGRSEDIQLVETRLEGLQENFTGLAAELDSLRLFHRRTLMELPIGVCILGQDHEIILWNNAMQGLSGIESSYITGGLVERLPAPWDALLLDFVSDSKAQLKQEIELDSGLHWLTLHKTFNTDASSADTVLLVEDITESQLLEDELIHSERLASVGRLAAGVAHEIGNPVTGIASLAQNLRAESEDPELQDISGDILTQTERITSIVQSLVNFSHGGIHMEGRRSKTVNVRSCASEAIKLLLLDKDATQIEFSNLCSADHQVIGDPQRIIQVLLNLLSNARDASAAGQTVVVDSEDPGYGRLSISITDAGRGIPEEQFDQLFEPFFTTKEPGKGTGLGLALVYNIIEDHGGEITVESNAQLPGGRGTRFLVTLPAE